MENQKRGNNLGSINLIPKPAKDISRKKNHKSISNIEAKFLTKNKIKLICILRYPKTVRRVLTLENQLTDKCKKSK